MAPIERISLAIRRDITVQSSQGDDSQKVRTNYIMERTAEIKRETKETKICVKLNLDGSGKVKLATGIPFYDHMLTLFAVHGFFDLSVDATGDIDVDYHHTIEEKAYSDLVMRLRQWMMHLLLLPLICQNVLFWFTMSRQKRTWTGMPSPR